MVLIDAEVTDFKNPPCLRTINDIMCSLALRCVPQIDDLTCCLAFWYTVRLHVSMSRSGTAEGSFNVMVGQTIPKDCLPLT